MLEMKNFADQTTFCWCISLGTRWTDVNWTQGSHAVLKVLIFKIGSQDLEKVLNLAKMYIRYWKVWKF